MYAAATPLRHPPPLFLSTPPPPPQFSSIQFRPNKQTLPRSSSLASRTLKTHTPHISITSTVADRLNSLVSEFKSLPEPIDRVKRLLHYATLLPDFDPSGRTELNRVKGCTAQVWLESSIDSAGAVRFRVDSDSEITKGFCYCLIWLLDGAEAGEVLGLDIDDLGEMNVGVMPIRVSSRVNTWHNVLTEMKKRTKALILERYGETELRLETFLCQNAGL